MMFSYWLCKAIVLTNFSVYFLSDDAEEAAQVEGSEVSAADVVLYGLNIIVPLMTAELLKVILDYICFLLRSMC